VHNGLREKVTTLFTIAQFSILLLALLRPIFAELEVRKSSRSLRAVSCRALLASSCNETQAM
jgi:hypothetical protein